MEAEDNVPELTDKATIKDLIANLKNGSQSLTADTTRNLVCDEFSAWSVIMAADRDFAELVFSGQVTESLWLGGLTGSLTVAGSVNGNLEVKGTIGGGLEIEGSVTGDLEVWGTITCNVDISGSVCGNLGVFGSVCGNLDVLHGGSVGKDLFVYDTGSVGSDLYVWGTVSGNVSVSKRGSVDGDVIVLGSVDGNLQPSGFVGGDVGARGSLGGDADVSGFVGGDVDVSGFVGGDVDVRGSLGGDADVSGFVGGDVGVRGSLCGDLRLRPSNLTQLSHLSAGIGGKVYLGEHLNLGRCDFRNFSDFDKLRFLGSNGFGAESNERQQLSFEDHRPDVSQAERSAICRQLRQALENQGNRPTAGDFYYQETEARRLNIAERTAHKWSAPEWLVLSAYKSISAYGTRASQAFGWFITTALVASMLLAFNGIELPDSYHVSIRLNPNDWEVKAFFSTLLFTVQSMVSFFKPPSAGLSTFEGWLQVFLRFAGPVLLAQSILAIRERVAR